MYCVDPLTEYDYAQVEAIFLRTFPRTDDADFAAAWRTKECNYSLGLYHKATLVGFAITCLEAVASQKQAHLWFIAVDAAYRASGAGTQLLTAVIDAVVNCAEMPLALTPDNDERVINWYKRHGFRVTRQMPFVHRDIPTCWMALTPSTPSSPISTETSSTRASMDSLDDLEI
jgi:ribosomal protein S18 acetylase RimI-like enzyme